MLVEWKGLVNHPKTFGVSHLSLGVRGSVVLSSRAAALTTGANRAVLPYALMPVWRAGVRPCVRAESTMSGEPAKEREGLLIGIIGDEVCFCCLPL